MRQRRGTIAVTPRAGVRRRFHALLDTGRLHLVLQNDRFAASRPVVLDERMTNIALRIESDSPEPHPARLQVAGVEGRYAVRSGRTQIATFELTRGEAATIELPVEAGRPPVEFIFSRVIES